MFDKIFDIFGSVKQKGLHAVVAVARIVARKTMKRTRLFICRLFGIVEAKSQLAFCAKNLVLKHGPDDKRHCSELS